MGSRIVLPYLNSTEYVQKIIPSENLLISTKLPTFNEYENNPILNLSNDIPPEVKTAIEQQYNEWYSWFTSPEDIRKYLAPIVGTGWDIYSNTPILYFPRFTPLLDEKSVCAHNSRENLILTGAQINQLHINDFMEFFRAIPEVCNYLDLNEDDIICNPSNIGFHSIFGLRIIDYGLPG